MLPTTPGEVSTLITDPSPGLEPVPSPVRPPTVASPGRRVFHTLIAVAGWAVFAWWWWIVLHRVGRSEMRFTGLFILVSLVVCVAVTGLWVMHNRMIFRRKGARTGVRDAKLDYSHDPLGRAVTFEVPERALRNSPIVRILFEPDRKRYRPMRPDAPPPPAA